MPSKSQCTLYLVNTALFALGLAVTAVAGAVLTHHKELLDNVPDSDAFVHSALKNGPGFALASGVILMFIGVMGCYAARNFEKGLAKCVLFVYSFLALVLFVVALVAGVVELHMSGTLHTYSDTGSKDVHAVDQKIFKALQGFSNTTFDKCCSGGQPNKNVEACTVLNGMWDQARYAGACANKATFQTDFFAWLSHALRPLGIVSIVVGVAAFMLLVASCCLLWRSKKADAAAKAPLRDAEKGQGYYAQAQYQPPSSTAGRLT
mmetsp:Transcript_7824/g.18644  ORF Transcript_7824/g.18644 Transcript_7824/m.18644 type:complete len:263 (+) Transcript_7824:38-826(+)